MNEIDEALSRLCDPFKSIDEVIAYQRKCRANFEAGVKPKKEIGEVAPPAEAQANLAKLGLVKSQPRPGITRR